MGFEVIRLLNVYNPGRTLILLVGEALVVWASFLIGTMLRYREDSYLVLNFEHGYIRLLLLTIAVLCFSHWRDLYNVAHIEVKAGSFLELLLLPAMAAFALAAVNLIFPRPIPADKPYLWELLGLIVLCAGLVAWRSAYAWLAQHGFLQQRVYVLGAGERASRLVHGLREVPQLGIEIVGWGGNITGELTRESLAQDLLKYAKEGLIHRVIVAMEDRRDSMPVLELLRLRLNGVHVEEATSWLEKISGKIEVEQLYPSWIIFATGFRFSGPFPIVRRALNMSVALIGLLLALPLLPFIALAIALDSPGPLFYAQKRVGHMGKIFYCHKLRTMRRDAEADTGPTWAGDDDPRITRVGRFLRTWRFDEIPQLWCVLKGDMGLVGPRPERPEFVEWLTKEIPYYGVRHMVRPGITGWAQVMYRYGNTLEDAREKLQYDLFYIKNASLALDVLIMLQTIKIVTLGRGAQ
jgi:sugar transferase (PEP-CTERM system associated)